MMQLLRPLEGHDGSSTLVAQALNDVAISLLNSGTDSPTLLRLQLVRTSSVLFGRYFNLLPTHNSLA